MQAEFVTRKAQRETSAHGFPVSIAKHLTIATTGRNRLPLFLQPKLTVSHPGDAYELEADRVADQVMRMPAPAVQRACAECGGASQHEEELEQGSQREAAAASKTTPLGGNPLANLGPGEPLDRETLAYFEPRYGYNFSQVRVHTGSSAAHSAQAIHARAYTAGPNVVFAEGEWAPASSAGKRLLAHELAHVVQQRGASQVSDGPRSNNDLTTREHTSDHIDRSAFGASAGLPLHAAPAGVIQREVPRWWRDFLENNKIDFTISPSDLDLPVVGTPRAGVRRNPNGTWTVVIGNEDHTVGLDEIDDILGSIGGGTGTTPSPGTVGPTRPGLPTTFDPTVFNCPPGEYYDFLRRRCLPDRPAPTAPLVPPLTMPEFPSWRQRRITFFGMESGTIDHFVLDSAALPSGATGELARLVTLLNANPDADVRVDGHTDNSGTPEHNQTLSEERAEAVRAELVTRGVVNPDRLRVRGIGARVPVNPEERTAEERAQNRRVEVWFELPPGEIAERYRLRPPVLTLPGPTGE